MEKVQTEIKRYRKETFTNTKKDEELKQELRNFKEKYLVLFNNSTSGIAYHKILYDSNGKPINYIITDVNPQYEIILLIKKEDVINKTATEAYHVAEPPYIDIYSKVVETQKSHSFEANFPSVEKYVKISVFSLKKGEFITVFDDISERKKFELKLKESEEKYRKTSNELEALIDIIPGSFFCKNKRGEYTRVNQNFSNNFNIKKEEAVGKTSFDFFPKEQAEKFHKDDLEVMENGDPQIKIEMKTDFSTDFQRLLIMSKIPQINENGEVTGLVGLASDISEQKRSEIELRKSEEKFRVLFNNSTNGISFHRIVYDTKNNPINYVITDVNPRYEKILSIKKENIINKLATEAYKIENPPFLEKYSSVAETQESLSFESYFPPMKKYFEISVISPRKGEFITVFDDISERKISEQKLKDSEEKYRDLVNDANSIILKWGIDGKVSFINEFGELFFGYSKSQLVGKHVIGTIVPKTETTGRDLERLMKEICQNPEKYKNNVNENITRYGRKVWISWTNKAIKDDQGNLTGILSVGNDMTDRRRAAQEIKESEEKFRTITEQNFIGIAILQGFKFKYINQQFSDTIGYSSKELIKWKPKELYKIIHPEDRERVITFAENRNFNESKAPVELEFRIITKTGKIIWLEIISKSITYKGKKADLISTLDITGKKEAERIVLEENRKLIELNKMRKDIITRVSHELKTPLTSIYGASQLLLNHLNIKIDDEVLKFIEIFHRGALRLKKLVENLIDASRIEYGKLELNIQTFDLVKIVKECINEMSYLIDNRNLIVKLDLPNKLDINVDKIRLQQVITNILSNAIKNTQINGKIYVSLVHNLEYTDLIIKDTGIGITKKEMELLFEKFGKIERYGMDLGVDIEGSGLGLYISKEIVESHGGKILVESDGRNKGARFIIRL